MTDFPEYQKIQSIYKRDQKGKFLPEWSTSEIGFLQDIDWRWTEKVDGTNIRVRVGLSAGSFKIGGRTDNAQIPSFLYDRLVALFGAAQLDEDVVLYGEGYGAKIQKGGGNYIPDGCDFVLFDAWCGGWWLQRSDVLGIAADLGISVVPEVFVGSIGMAIQECKDGFKSAWSGVNPEGLVGTPMVQLFDRRRNRIITKMKVKDFQ